MTIENGTGTVLGLITRDIDHKWNSEKLKLVKNLAKKAKTGN